MSTNPAIGKLALSMRESAIAFAVVGAAKARLRKMLEGDTPDEAVALLKKVVKAGASDEILETKLAKNIMKRKGVLKIPPGAEATSMLESGRMALRLDALRGLVARSEAFQRSALLAKRLTRMRRGFVSMIERMPVDEWVNLVEEFRTGFQKAARADRAEIIKRFTPRVNEILGIFHPEVIEELNHRAAIAIDGLRRSPKIMKEFELVSQEAKVLRFVLRAGSDSAGSPLPTLQSVDGLGVLVLRHRATGERFYLMLGDIQVKSFNVPDFVIRGDGRPGQLIVDAVRKARGTDIALTSFEGGTIPFKNLIDPAGHGVRAPGFDPIAVGQRPLTRGELGDLRRWGISPREIGHDVSTRKSEDLLRAMVRAGFGER